MLHFNNKYFFFSINYLANPHNRYNNLFILRYKKFFFYNLSLINYSMNISLKFIQAVSRGNGAIFILHTMRNLESIRRLRILRTAYLYSSLGANKGLISNFKHQNKVKGYKTFKEKKLDSIPPSAIIFLNPSDHFYEIKEIQNYQIVSLGVSSAHYGAGNLFNYNIYGASNLREFYNNLFTTLFLLHVFLGYKERYLGIYSKFFTKFSSLRNSRLLRRYRAFSYLKLFTFNFRRRQILRVKQRRLRKAQRVREKRVLRKKRGKPKDWLRKKLYPVKMVFVPSRKKVRKFLKYYKKLHGQESYDIYYKKLHYVKNFRFKRIKTFLHRFDWERRILRKLSIQRRSDKKLVKLRRKGNLNVFNPRNYRKVTRWVKKRRLRFLKSNERKRYYAHKIHRFNERSRSTWILNNRMYNSYTRLMTYSFYKKHKRRFFNKYRNRFFKFNVYRKLKVGRPIPLRPIVEKTRKVPYHLFRKSDLQDQRDFDHNVNTFFNPTKNILDFSNIKPKKFKVLAGSVKELEDFRRLIREKSRERNQAPLRKYYTTVIQVSEKMSKMGSRYMNAKRLRRRARRAIRRTDFRKKSTHELQWIGFFLRKKLLLKKKKMPQYYNHKERAASLANKFKRWVSSIKQKKNKKKRKKSINK